jgi:hypothetical protein
LTLQPMLTVSGRVVIDGDASAGITGHLVRLQRVGPPFAGSGGSQTLTSSTTSFTMQGVLPGRYQLTVRAPAGSPWIAKSSILRGQDSLDVPVEIQPGENVSDWVLTITNRPSELAGTLLDSSGQAAPEYFVVVFSADRRFWAPPTRRVAPTRPGLDGRFSVKGLPAGEYFIATLTDLDANASIDATLLERLVDAAVRVTSHTPGSISTGGLPSRSGQGLSAESGDAAAARRAGSHAATIAAIAITAGTPANVHGSRVVVSNSSVVSTDDTASPAATPTTMPAPTQASPGVVMARTTCRGVAPSARRTPISRVRSAMTFVTTP